MSENVQGNRMWKLLAALLLAAVAAQVYYINMINNKLDKLEAQQTPAEQILAPPIQPLQSVAQAAPFQPPGPSARTPHRPLLNSTALNMPPDPFDNMAAMSKMFDEFFGDDFTSMPSMGATPPGSAPRVSVEQGKYIVTVELPGLDQSQLNVQAQGDMLTISGVKSSSRQSQGFQSSESQSFQRSFNLPGPVDASKLKVDYDNKTLKITCPMA